MSSVFQIFWRCVPVLFLSACAATSADSTVDDTGAPDTADTPPEGWPESIPDCTDLVSPFPMASADDLTAAWAARPQVDIAFAAMGLARTASETTGCPSLVSDPCGVGTVLSGDCETGGVTATGSAISYACEDGGGWSWAPFAVEDTGAAWSFSADGGFSYEGGDGSATWTATLALHGVCEDPACNGAFEWSGRMVTGVYGPVRVTASFDTDPRAGDFCLDEGAEDVRDCPEEQVDWTVFQGDHSAVVLWDGDVNCDGCGRLFIDDVEVGSWCR